MSLLSIVPVPMIKDKQDKVSDIDYYRPIALASSISKVLEKILLTRLDPHLHTTLNTFGFKKEHGTDT